MIYTTNTFNTLIISKPKMFNMYKPERILILSKDNHSISCLNLNSLLELSPCIRAIVFVGTDIFQSNELIDIISCCQAHGVSIIFGKFKETNPNYLTEIIRSSNVIHINVLSDSPQLEQLYKLKKQFHADHLTIHEVDLSKESAQDIFTKNNSYEFYSLPPDLHTMPCYKLLQEPMINYDGSLLGCWQHPKHLHPVNVCSIGITKALKSHCIKTMLKMLRTGKVYKNCPCARCEYFIRLLWHNKKLDI